MLEDPQAEALVAALWPRWRDSREKSKAYQDWALGNQPLPVVPDTATAEFKSLQEKAVTPWLGLLVQSMTQALQVDGYRQKAADEDSQLWSVWQANGMDAKQIGLYEAAFTTGVAYMAILPVDSPGVRSKPAIDGVLPVPEWRPYSSAEMTAFYESPHDEWPAYAIAAERVPDWSQSVTTSKWRVTLFDEDAVYLFIIEGVGSQTLLESRPHDLGVCPIVDYTNRKTITGRAIGEVEPYLAVASRIDQDVFDRLMVQRYGSWRVRWATGLETPASPDALAKQDLDLKVGDVLTSDNPATAFGSLPETPLEGHLRAPTEDVRMLAAVSQTPPQLLTADLVNVSADALAAIEAGYNRKIAQRKTTFGESHEQSFALSAQIMGLSVDTSAEVQWRDMETRSMAAAADAFGKLATMLEIPVEVLWDKLGFLTEQDIARAKELRATGDSTDALVRELTSGLTSA